MLITSLLFKIGSWIESERAKETWVKSKGNPARNSFKLCVTRVLEITMNDVKVYKDTGGEEEGSERGGCIVHRNNPPNNSTSQIEN